MRSKSKRVLQEEFCTVKIRKSRQHGPSVELQAACPEGKQKTLKKNKGEVAGTQVNLNLPVKIFASLQRQHTAYKGMPDQTVHRLQQL